MTQVAEAGLARHGRHHPLGVLAAAHLERGVHAGLADVEVDALALVLDLDEVGAGRRRTSVSSRTRPPGRSSMRAKIDEPAPGLRLVAPDQAGHDAEVDVAAGQHDARRRRSSAGATSARLQGRDADGPGALHVELGPVHQQSPSRRRWRPRRR